MFFTARNLLLLADILAKVSDFGSSIYNFSFSVLVCSAGFKAGASHVLSAAPSFSPSMGPSMSPSAFSTKQSYGLWGLSVYTNYYLFLWVLGESIAFLNILVSNFLFYSTTKEKRAKHILLLLFLLRQLPPFLILLGTAGYLNFLQVIEDFYQHGEQPHFTYNLTYYLSVSLLAFQLVGFLVVGSLMVVSLGAWSLISRYRAKAERETGNELHASDILSCPCISIPLVILEPIGMMLTTLIAIPARITALLLYPFFACFCPSFVNFLTGIRANIVKQRRGDYLCFELGVWYGNGVFWWCCICGTNDVLFALLLRFDAIFVASIASIYVYFINYIIACKMIQASSFSMEDVGNNLTQNGKSLAVFWIVLKVLQITVNIFYPLVKLVILGKLWLLQSTLQKYVELEAMQLDLLCRSVTLSFLQSLLNQLKSLPISDSSSRSQLAETETRLDEVKSYVDQSLLAVTELKRQTEKKIGQLTEFLYGDGLLEDEDSLTDERGGRGGKREIDTDKI